MNYKTVKQCDEELAKIHNRKEDLLTLRQSLSDKESKAKARRNLTKLEAAQYESLVNGKSYDVIVKTVVCNEDVSKETITLTLSWEDGYRASEKATIKRVSDTWYSLESLKKSKTVRGYIDKFNDRIEKFEAKMVKKYGEDWVSLIE